MKKLLLLIIVSTISLTVLGQSKLNQNAINEYCYYINQQFNYGNDGMKSLIYVSVRERMPSASLAEIEIAIENMKTNVSVREASLKYWTKVAPNEDLLYANLKSIGISAVSSNTLAKYIISKYGYNPENNEPNKIKTKGEIALEKRKILEEEEAERKQKEVEKKQKLEEERINKIRSITYLPDSITYKSYKETALKYLKQTISRFKTNENVDVEAEYEYSFMNYPNSIELSTEKVVLTRGKDLGIFRTFRTYMQPSYLVEGVYVPVQFKVSNISVKYCSGITQIKLKKDKIEYADANLSEHIKNFISQNFKETENGIYEVKYTFGNLNDLNINSFDQKFIKKSGSWLLKSGLIAGSLLLN